MDGDNKTVLLNNSMIPNDPTDSLLCNNCGTDSGCPLCLHVCTVVHTLLREELCTQSPEGGSTAFSFHIGPQGNGGFIGRITQEVSLDKELLHDHWDESIPSPHPSSPFQSGLIVSFQENHVDRHDQARSRHGNVEPRPNHSGFIEDSPHSFLLWQQPAVEARHLFEVRTCADEQQPKHQDAIERVHICHVGSLLFDDVIRLVSSFSLAVHHVLWSGDGR